MYNRFRNELEEKLGFLPENLLADVMVAVDKTSERYDFSEKETHLAPKLDEFPPECKAYMVAKKVEGLAETTLEAYGRTLALFFGAIRKRPADVTATDLRVWLYQYQQDRGVTAWTLEYYRIIIHSFFDWAVEEGYLPANPVATVKPIKYEKKQRSALSRVELEYIRSACKTVRERAILETMYSTGCRVSELANLRREDINWDTRTVHVLGKGNKHRTCYLNARAEVCLQAYLNSRTDDDPHVFVGCRKPYAPLHKDGLEYIIRVIHSRVATKVPKRVTPHVLRHTTATLALAGGMKITNISAMLGHAKLETTMVYAETNVTDIHADHTRCVV